MEESSPLITLIRMLESIKKNPSRVMKQDWMLNWSLDISGCYLYVSGHKEVSGVESTVSASSIVLPSRFFSPLSSGTQMGKMEASGI